MEAALVFEDVRLPEPPVPEPLSPSRKSSAAVGLKYRGGSPARRTCFISSGRCRGPRSFRRQGGGAFPGGGTEKDGLAGGDHGHGLPGLPGEEERNAGRRGDFQGGRTQELPVVFEAVFLRGGEGCEEGVPVRQELPLRPGDEPAVTELGDGLLFRARPRRKSP